MTECQMEIKKKRAMESEGYTLHSPYLFFFSQEKTLKHYIFHFHTYIRQHIHYTYIHAWTPKTYTYNTTHTMSHTQTHTHSHSHSHTNKHTWPRYPDLKPGQIKFCECTVLAQCLKQMQPAVWLEIAVIVELLELREAHVVCLHPLQCSTTWVSCTRIYVFFTWDSEWRWEISTCTTSFTRFPSSPRPSRSSILYFNAVHVSS